MNGPFRDGAKTLCRRHLVAQLECLLATGLRNRPDEMMPHRKLTFSVLYEQRFTVSEAEVRAMCGNFASRHFTSGITGGIIFSSIYFLVKRTAHSATLWPGGKTHVRVIWRRREKEKYQHHRNWVLLLDTTSSIDTLGCWREAFILSPGWFILWRKQS